MYMMHTCVVVVDTFVVFVSYKIKMRSYTHTHICLLHMKFYIMFCARITAIVVCVVFPILCVVDARAYFYTYIFLYTQPQIR